MSALVSAMGGGEADTHTKLGGHALTRGGRRRRTAGLGGVGKVLVILAVWLLNATINSKGKRSLSWTHQHLASERAALTRYYNLREMLRRSLNVTTWVAHGLVDRDNIEDLMRYEARRTFLVESRHCLALCCCWRRQHG